MLHKKIRIASVIAGVALIGASLAGCSNSSDEGSGSDKIEISYLIGNDEQSVKTAEKLVAAFEKTNPDIKVSLDLQPVGAEGDNLMKTKLSTGEMNDVFNYNTGSLMQALNPDSTLTDLSGEAWVSDVNKDFIRVVSTDTGMYGAPVGTAFGGGVLYNTKVYEQLGLKVPTTWTEFMANSQKIKDQLPGVAPVLQSYGETWTSQIFVLADFGNVNAAAPTWAEDYTAGKAKYADKPAQDGFQYQQEAFDAGLFNEDFASMKLDKALKALVDGTGAQFPMLTNQTGAINQIDPKGLVDIGFFALPATDAKYTSATIWMPNALYIPKTTEGDKLAAAKKFVAFVSGSAEACAIANETGIPSGPYVTKACELTGDIPQMVQDLQTYLDSGKTAPALEFLSPIKGPNLENITIEVGSGITDAQSGASAYDEDVKKQAQQLGLPGW